MPYTSKVTAVRPAGVQWFNAANPAVSKSELDWVKAQPGFVQLAVEAVNANTLVSTIVFADKASYDAMDAARANRDDFKARKMYCEVNGISRAIERS